MKKLIFFAIASGILLFSIFVVNITPIGLIGGQSWSQQACSSISDEIDQLEKQNYSDEQLKPYKKNLNRCNNKKAMVGLDYVTSNFNIIFGFICALLGFLLFMNLINIGKYIGLIGLGVGAVGFVLTFVYVIESGLVFDDIDGSSDMRIESDGAYLEWKGNKYVCIFYDKDDEDSVYLRYSDYGKKYLNYHKDLWYPEGDKKFMFRTATSTSSVTPLSGGCIYRSIDDWDECKDLDEGTSNSQTSKLLNLNSKIKYYDDSGNPKGDCDKLYNIYMSTYRNENNLKKYIYDRWLTTLIFSCFIFLLDIGLAIFGFLLFRESGGSSGSVAIK